LKEKGKRLCKLERKRRGRGKKKKEAKGGRIGGEPPCLTRETFRGIGHHKGSRRRGGGGIDLYSKEVKKDYSVASRT